METKVIRYNVLTEARKVLRGEKTKAKGLLCALADEYVSAHSTTKTKKT